jgi:hypothetical protein
MVFLHLGLGDKFILSADSNVLNFSIDIFPIGNRQIVAMLLR